MEIMRDELAVRDLLFDIGKIVDCALAGKQDALIDYATQLGAKLEQAGETECADRVRQIIGKQKTKTASLARLASRRPVPVDSESRLPVADEEMIASGTVKILLTEDQNASVNRFLKRYRAADRLAQKGLDAAASLLLYGPPGCGKTQLAKYVASELCLPLVTARMDSLISSYLGSTAKNLRALFDFAASHPCVLFLDEFDALAKMRDDSRELGELKRVVISLLQNIDILGRNHVLVAATNHDHLLDPAVWRRFAERIYVGYPPADVREGLFREYLRGYCDEETIHILTCLTEQVSGAMIRDVAEECVRESVLRDCNSVTLDEARNACLRITSQNGKIADVRERIAILYQADKKQFTQARLAHIFGCSQPQISRILKEMRNGDEEALGD